MLTRLLLWTRPIRYWFDRKPFEYCADRRPIVGLQDKFKGLPMLVVGNGTSLNKTHLDDFDVLNGILFLNIFFTGFFTGVGG